MQIFNGSMLINFSNHPLSQWSDKQINVAKKLYGEIIDFPFPLVDPTGDELYIKRLADFFFSKMQREHSADRPTIHIMGEMTFVYEMVKRLHKCGYECIASTTNRVVSVRSDGVKESSFEFVRFRTY